MPGPIRNKQIQSLIQNLVKPEDSSTDVQETEELLANNVIEIVNISKNPEGIETSNVIEVKADDWEQFQGNLPGVQEGDHLRVRTKSTSGNVGNWMNLQATGTGKTDTRNAEIFADALAMEADKNGVTELIYLGDGMVSEPNATVQLMNQSSGETFQFTTDANGQLPEGATIKGFAGDQVSIAISDGTNNTNFSVVAGTMEIEGTPPPIDLKEPAVWAKKHLNQDGTPKVETKRFEGPLFVDGVKAEDVKQGSLANCYFCGAVSAVAAQNPEAIQNMIKKNIDGTYTVTFKKRLHPNSSRFKDVRVKVDGDLFVNSGGKPLYGSSIGTSQNTEDMELWFPILEKAYAKFNGNSYDEIGNGGKPGEVMSAILGGNSYYSKIAEPSTSSTGFQFSGNMDRIYRQIERAVNNDQPVTASTYGKDSEEAERYSGKKIYAWHVYSVLGTEEVDGQKYVQLRNPWGSTEPGYDGKNDGIFKLPLEEFAHLYRNIDICKN